MEHKQKQLIVVKIGTSSLTLENGSIAPEKIKAIVAQIAKLKERGHSVVIVTSGAIAAGFTRLGYNERPKTIPGKQASAAVGQGILIEEYTKYLLQFNYIGAQILLNKDDFRDKRRYTNVFNALEVLLKRGAIPIINENDTVSIQELKFGDNDRLSALVAGLIHADLLVLLTDVDGLYTADPRKDAGAERVALVTEISDDLMAMAGGAGSSVGTGGMTSKITAAKIAVSFGVPVFICSSTDEAILEKIVDGEANGTYFQAADVNLNTKRQWVAYHSDVCGSIHVDKGAALALEKRNKSLLPSGIVSVEGVFVDGDVVEVWDENDVCIGKGAVSHSSAILQQIKGLSSKEISARFGLNKTEAIHRDNWLGTQK